MQTKREIMGGRYAAAGADMEDLQAANAWDLPGDVEAGPDLDAARSPSSGMPSPSSSPVGPLNPSEEAGTDLPGSRGLQRCSAPVSENGGLEAAISPLPGSTMQLEGISSADQCKDPVAAALALPGSSPPPACGIPADQRGTSGGATSALAGSLLLEHTVPGHQAASTTAAGTGAQELPRELDCGIPASVSPGPAWAASREAQTRAGTNPQDVAEAATGAAGPAFSAPDSCLQRPVHALNAVVMERSEAALQQLTSSCSQRTTSSSPSAENEPHPGSFEACTARPCHRPSGICVGPQAEAASSHARTHCWPFQHQATPCSQAQMATVGTSEASQASAQACEQILTSTAAAHVPVPSLRSAAAGAQQLTAQQQQAISMLCHAVQTMQQKTTAGAAGHSKPVPAPPPVLQLLSQLQRQTAGSLAQLSKPMLTPPSSLHSLPMLQQKGAIGGAQLSKPMPAQPPPFQSPSVLQQTMPTQAVYSNSNTALPAMHLQRMLQHSREALLRAQTHGRYNDGSLEPVRVNAAMLQGYQAASALPLLGTATTGLRTEAAHQTSSMFGQVISSDEHPRALLASLATNRLSGPQMYHLPHGATRAPLSAPAAQPHARDFPQLSNCHPISQPPSLCESLTVGDLMNAAPHRPYVPAPAALPCASPAPHCDLDKCQMNAVLSQHSGYRGGDHWQGSQSTPAAAGLAALHPGRQHGPKLPDKRQLPAQLLQQLHRAHAHQAPAQSFLMPGVADPAAHASQLLPFGSPAIQSNTGAPQQGAVWQSSSLYGSLPASFASGEWTTLCAPEQQKQPLGKQANQALCTGQHRLQQPVVLHEHMPRQPEPDRHDHGPEMLRPIQPSGLDPDQACSHAQPALAAQAVVITASHANSAPTSHGTPALASGLTRLASVGGAFTQTDVDDVQLDGSRGAAPVQLQLPSQQPSSQAACMRTLRNLTKLAGRQSKPVQAGAALPQERWQVMPEMEDIWMDIATELTTQYKELALTL